MNITNKELTMEEYMELKGTLEAMQYVKKNIDPPCSVFLYHEDTSGRDGLALRVTTRQVPKRIEESRYTDVFTMEKLLSERDIMESSYNPVEGFLYRFCQEFNEGYSREFERRKWELLT